LIAAICVIEAILSWSAIIQSPQINAGYFICYFRIDYVFEKTLFFIDKPAYNTTDADGNIYKHYQQNWSVKTIMFSQEMFFQYIQLVSLFINLTLCKDLIQTLRNPFETTKTRFYKYVAISVLFPIAIIGVMWLLSDQRVPTLYTEHTEIFTEYANLQIKRPAREYYNLVLGLCLSIYMLVGFYSIVFAYRRLVRPGVSIEMRKLFLKKHAIYVIVFIIIWIFMLLYNYY